MNNALQNAENRMKDIQARQRPYLQKLVNKLLVTYALPLAGALLLATVGAVLLSNFIPSSTATAIVFALNVGLFYYGWNALEKRTQATALFVLYTTGSRERRILASLIAQAQKGNTSAKDDLAVQVNRYEAVAEDFIQHMQEA